MINKDQDNVTYYFIQQMFGLWPTDLNLLKSPAETSPICPRHEPSQQTNHSFLFTDDFIVWYKNHLSRCHSSCLGSLHRDSGVGLC